MNKLIVPIIVALIIVIGIVGYFVLKPEAPASQDISTFEECVKAEGSIILESYPRQCVTKDGKRFVEKVLEGKTLYILWTVHIEGDTQKMQDDERCSKPNYQTDPLPSQYFGKFEIDLRGIEELQREAEKHKDSFGNNPKMHLSFAGEYFETELDPNYGNKTFRKYNWLELGHEIGIQSHAIYWSGKPYCWPMREFTPAGVIKKLTTLHEWAEKWFHDEKKVNAGLTYTPGVKLDKPIFGNDKAITERFLDRKASELGYRIAFEDWDGCIEDNPMPGQRPPYLYKAHYDDGTEMYKICFQGAVRSDCEEGSPRCESPQNAKRWINKLVELMNSDPNPDHLYYYAFATHSANFYVGAMGKPSTEWEGTMQVLKYLDQLVAFGVKIEYITPKDFVALFEGQTSKFIIYYS
ncbi:MAG: hypothetical protein ACE5K0_01370 [Candidatus Methanofastidiosia archaeon]